MRYPVHVPFLLIVSHSSSGPQSSSTSIVSDMVQAVKDARVRDHSSLVRHAACSGIIMSIGALFPSPGPLGLRGMLLGHTE